MNIFKISSILRNSSYIRGLSPEYLNRLGYRAYGRAFVRSYATTQKEFRSVTLQKFWKYFVFGSGAALGLGGVLTTSNYVTASAAQVSGLSLKLLLQQADDLYNSNNFDELYELLSVHKNEENDEILWRLGRAAYSRSLVTKDSKERNSLVKEALGYAEKALIFNENNYAVHKWMAILIDSSSAIDGSKARIQQTFVVLKHMERACELNPKDGTSWHVLALWHYNISDIPWYQRKAAAVLFATPPESSFEEALKHFLHAEMLEPNFYSKNLLMIGKCYQRTNQPSEALEYLRRARDYIKSVSNPTEDDKETRDEATQLLKQLGV